MSTITITEPATATDEECYEEALEWANSIREKYGLEEVLEMSQGHPRHASGCALAKTLTGVGDTHCVVDSEIARIYFGEADYRTIDRWPTSPLTHEFVKRFDAGHYPELEI